MIRGIVTAVIEGVIKRFSASGRSGESFDNREYFQHYGFTSRPLPGAEIVIQATGNNIIAIASDDRRYRLSLVDGEVALYTDEGDKIHLKRDRIIEIIGGEKIIVSTKVLEATATVSTTLSTATLTATATSSATVTAPQVTVVASTKVTMTTPLLAVTGNITCANLTAVTNVADQNGAKTMAQMRTIYNSHTHSHPADGQTIPVTAQGM
jgi:phage baseplate assembly protein V